jgi:transcriptional regulator GlxA family with amidase domain
VAELKHMAQILIASLDWQSAARLAGYSAVGMAKLLSVSLRQIERHFHDVMKLRVADYLRQLRMHDAKILLYSDLRIFEVSILLGYRYPEHFARAVLNQLGVSPTQWAKRSNENRALAASAFLEQYCELLRERAADITDPDESKRLLQRIPYGCNPSASENVGKW